MTAIIIQPTKTKTLAAVDQFVTKLTGGERLLQGVVSEIMTDIFGDTASGKWHWKGATDLIEASFVKILLSSDFKSLESVQELQSLVPHHSARSQEQIQYQQFSTPLSLAWIVAQLAGIQKGDILLEPSAGTGILAATAINRLFYGEPRHVILNEISPSRKTLLREIFDPKYEVFGMNAEYIHDVLPQPKQASEQPTVVGMNPPFSSAIGNDKRDREACMRHLRSALLRLADNGRLVGIFPHWLSPEKQPKFFASLPAQLQLSLYVGGEHYRYHGTTMETRILVFDKIPQAEMPKSIDLTSKFTADQLSRVANGHCPDRIVIAQQSAPAQNLVEIPALPLFAGLPLFQFAPSQELEISYTPVKSERKAASIAIPVITIEPRQQFTNLVQLQYQRNVKATEVMSDGSYSGYQCDILIEGATPHPTAICESVSMAAIESPLPTVHPTLPERVITEALASDCQLETLVYACQAHSVMLDTPWIIAPNGQIAVTNPDNPDGKYHRQGYYCGHNTGLGKSRIIALLMLTNWCEGRKKAVWVSKNNELFEDAQAEWMAVGGKKSQLTSLSKIAQDKPILMTEGILFVTYGTLRSSATGTKQSRVDQIINWLGDDWDGSMCFDEAHYMGNAAGEEGDRGATKPSAQALAGTNLVNRLPNARVTYLSATAAEKVSSLSYCQRLGLWQTAAFPFSSRNDFISSIEHAGVAGLEMVATDLKAVGLYLSPSLSFDGVTFETLVHELTPEQRQAWDIYAQVFRYIHAGLGEVLRSINLETQTGSCTNGRAKAAAIGIFESVKLRFFNSLICAAKAPTLINAIEQDIENGYASVVQLVSTGAASMDRLLADPEMDFGDLRSMDFSPKEGIIEYLHTSFPIHIYQVTQDEHGNAKSELMKDVNGEPIISQEAVLKRDQLIERMAMLPPVNGLLDTLIWHFGEGMVSEVTGRSKRISLRNGKYQLVKRSANSNVAEAAAFMADETRVLVFSKSGGTGRSYHAAENVKNQRLRRHYLLESGFSAKDAIQGLGRTHRSGQVQTPQIVLITTNVRGELRFTSTIASRLAALGAITRGQRDTGCNAGLFDETTNNFSSVYATSALGEFFADLRRGTVAGISLAEFTEYTGLRLLTDGGQLLESLPKMNTFLNRLLALPIGLQNMLFADFEERIAQRVSAAKANDSYDRGVENLFADGGFEVISTQVLNTHSSGAETICHTIDKLDRPSVISVVDAKRIVTNQKLNTYRQNKTGKLAVAGFLDTRTTREGATVNVLIVYEPTGTTTSWRKVDEPDFLKSWVHEPASDQYWHQWQQLVDLSPEFIRQRMFLVCGLLLPIWKKLPKENPKVVRLQANNGDILLGRLIDKNKIQLVYEKFGLNNNIKLSSEEIYDLIWNQREVKAVGDWNLQKFYYKGTYYLEILEVYGSDKIDRLKAIGCFTEMIKFRVKVFIPLDNAIEIMDKLVNL
jgi:predicted RNA methylase